MLIDFNDLSDGAKAVMNGIPFLAGMVKDVETPYYTKLLQSVITFCVIGIIGGSASIILTNKDRNDQLIKELGVLNSNLSNLTHTVAENRGEIKALGLRTKDRVYRAEWSEKNREQDARILHLERNLK